MPHTLVLSDRVEHVSVYCRDGTRLGSIERLMLDKASGAVAYAVIKTGGLLGSHHHCPIRWDALRFDPVRQVYQTDVTPEYLVPARPNSMKRPLTGGSFAPASALLDGVGRRRVCRRQDLCWLREGGGLRVANPPYVCRPEGPDRQYLGTRASEYR